MMNQEHLSASPVEEERQRRRYFMRPLATIALLGTLTSCSTSGDHETHEVRNAPTSADYSLDADPTFYSDVDQARSYIHNATARNRLDALARQPVAEWLSEDAVEAASDISRTIKKTKVDHTIPVFVSYAIPDRDLGGASAGGLDAAEYDAYVASISKAIGQEPAIVVVEPDALASVPDPKLSDQQRTERIGLLAHGLDTLHANTQTAVYLDAGNSAWKSPAEIASLLHEVADKTKYGVPGISLNVSNYQSDAETKQYAKEIEAAYGKSLYTLIDTSRNGDPQAAEYNGSNPWCNPPDQLIGKADAYFDANASVEEVYVKIPGESDGPCNDSSDPAGEFDGNLLLEQLQ